MAADDNAQRVGKRGFLRDLRDFLLTPPPAPTRFGGSTPAEREDLSQRIMQRLDIDVGTFSILNIHHLGIEAPGQFVFDKLLRWDGNSTYWPNGIAEAGRVDGLLDDIDIHLFGWRRFLGVRTTPLFHLKAARIKEQPGPQDLDSARYIIFECSGGYPIGHFIMYVRSPIAALGETEASQFFMAVGFDVYGIEGLGRGRLSRLVNPIWETIHNRATGNILNRFRDECEAEFRNLADGTGQ